MYLEFYGILNQNLNFMSFVSNAVRDLLLIFDNFCSPKLVLAKWWLTLFRFYTYIFATEINLIIFRNCTPLSRRHPPSQASKKASARFNELFLGICRDVELVVSHNDVNAHNKMRLGFVIIP